LSPLVIANYTKMLRDKVCYTFSMHTWDYDIGTLQQGEEGERWKLTRMILYGLGGEKIPPALLRKHLAYLRIPEDRRAFLRLILQ